MLRNQNKCWEKSPGFNKKNLRNIAFLYGTTESLHPITDYWRPFPFSNCGILLGSPGRWKQQQLNYYKKKKKDVDQKRGWNTGYQIEPEKLCFGRPSRLYVAFFCPFSDVLLWLPINLRTKILKLCLCNSFIVSLVPERLCRSPLNSEALYVLPRHGPRWLLPFIL